MTIQRIKGTQDLLDTGLYRELVNRLEKFFVRHNFGYIKTPILEPLDLFERTLGEHTDVVGKEMFVIQQREGSSETICLRPEATASTVRAFIENGIQSTPWKVFSLGSMFRYENPQKGRLREFTQCNIEIIGGESIAYDIYSMWLLNTLFTDTFLLDNYALQINFLGCSSDRIKFREQLFNFLTVHEQDLCQLCAQRKNKNILRVFDCKNTGCQKLYTKAPKITEYLCAVCAVEWDHVQKGLSALSVSYSVRPTLVRGLDYYDKTVFEFVSTELGAQSTFCGGGRYSKLVSELGGSRDYSSVGCAFGLERVLLLLESKKDLLIPAEAPLVVIIPCTSEQHVLGLLVADMVRQDAPQVALEIILDGSVKSMLRKADKLGARYALLIGSDEQAAQTITIKNLMTGTQEQVPVVELISKLV